MVDLRDGARIVNDYDIIVITFLTLTFVVFVVLGRRS